MCYSLQKAPKFSSILPQTLKQYFNQIKSIHDPVHYNDSYPLRRGCLGEFVKYNAHITSQEWFFNLATTLDQLNHSSFCKYSELEVFRIIAETVKKETIPYRAV